MQNITLSAVWILTQIWTSLNGNSYLSLKYNFLCEIQPKIEQCINPFLRHTAERRSGSSTLNSVVEVYPNFGVILS